MYSEEAGREMRYPRKSAHGMNIRILVQQLFFSVLGGTLYNALFSQGLKFTTPTIASGINILFPVLNFIAAVFSRNEELQFKSTAGCLKIAGTMLSVGGSLVVSFYSGFQISVNKSSVDWQFLRSSGTTPEPNSVGPVLIALSCLARFGWFQLQGWLCKDFPYPYTSTAIICLLSSIQCAIVGAGMKHTVKAWSLASTLRIVSVLYSGVFGSAITFLVTNLFITKKGPVFVSIFNPIFLIFVQIFGWAFFKENVYFGSLLGSALLLVGFIVALWANWKEVYLSSNTVDLEAGAEQGVGGTVDLEAGVEHSEAGNEDTHQTRRGWFSRFISWR
ncbi:WAT1-related protein At1g09380-like [Papaver somniferum]|uniref:WAT1-related protein At1g09380-like n=1 Tax=Papaver somniferum TaxID=3469 RepID=UPI000E705BA1|nr:WAT1-related protein At1g09380-like [Papaver somniferum]